MPRRARPDPLARRIGERLRELRHERGMTLEALAWARDDARAAGSKGHLSDLERGLAVPNVATLARLADSLGCSIADLVTFPERDERQRVADAVRPMTPTQVRRVLRFVLAAARTPGPAKKSSNRA